MTTFQEGLIAAKQAERKGEIASFHSDQGKIFAESNDGGFYSWWSPEIDDPEYIPVS